MNYSELKSIVAKLDKVAFKLPNGDLVPAHFHVTEVGQIDKNFIDCGGTIRKEEKISLQLWSANDYDHRLHPEKLYHILQLSEEKLGLKDSEIEVQYQGNTIENYGLAFKEGEFLLTPLHTDCLAREACAIPAEQVNTASVCTPGSNCC